MARCDRDPVDNARFVAARRVVFGIVLASFVLSFFHRTAPAAIAGELTRAFAINAATLGTLAATYFYVYTLLQIPVGRARRHARAAAHPGRPDRWWRGLGSLAFALAPTWELAAAGRTLVGVGVSVAFIAILKISAVWFPANRFATLNGVTMFAGNTGAVIAGAPLAWLVTQTSWRAGVRRARRAVDRAGASPRGCACATGRRIWASRPCMRPSPGRRHGYALDARAARRTRQPRHLARLLRQRRHRRQLPRVRRAVGGAVPRRTCTACRAWSPRSTRACCCSAWRSARC